MAGEAVAVAAAKAMGALTATKALKPATHRIKPRRKLFNLVGSTKPTRRSGSSQPRSGGGRPSRAATHC